VNEDLETIADEISNLMDQLDILMSQHRVKANTDTAIQLIAARSALLDAEDKVRFLL
jgi:hypothetical protein